MEKNAARNSTKVVWDLMRPVKGRIYSAMSLAGLAVVCSMSALVLLAWTFHESLVPGHGIAWGWFSLAVLAVVFAFLLRGGAFYGSHMASFALETDLRARLKAHLERLPLGVVEQAGGGALAKVMVDDVKALHTFVADSTPFYARAYVWPVLTLILLVYLDWRMALLALAVIVVGMVTMMFMMRGSAALSQEYNRLREQVSESVVEFVQAMPVVRTFDSGQASFGRYESALSAYVAMVVNWYRRTGVSGRITMVLLNALPTLVIFIWGGLYYLHAGSMSFSVWLAILLFGTGMAEAMYPFMWLYHLLEQSCISARRIDALLRMPILPQTAQPQVAKDSSIVFEHVDFAYEAGGETVLHDISFTVPEGSFTALVGASGAGKSTVARLIPRFWDVTAGRLLVGGVDVRDQDNEALLSQIAFVFQDNFLFTGTIADNIRLGQPDKTMEDVIEAAKAAQAHDFITALPEGYDTLIGERGSTLSGGQRQRISIARAILQNRPILILDEATAFTDPENELQLLKALQHLMKGKTVVMIAHRLGSVQHADQILMFEKGRLVEAGAPDTLKAQGGAFAQLWQAYQTAQQWQVNA